MTASHESSAPPFHWVTDQARAWRLVASILEHDGALFESVVSQTRAEGSEAIDKLLAALARSLVVRLTMSIGMDALDQLVTAELVAALQETEAPGGGG
jgi:hypothetical protein